MFIVLGDSLTSVTRRRDPSTNITHLGALKNDRWVPICGTIRIAIDTVFWESCVEPPTTCLWCTLKELT